MRRSSAVKMPRHATGARVSTKRPTSTLVEEVRRRKRNRNLAVAIGIIVAILAIAIAVGVYAYFTTTNAKLDLAPSNAAESLSTAAADEPFFVLCSAELGTASSAPQSYDMPENTQAYLLVRVDGLTRTLTFVSIPANTLVRFSDGAYHPLSDALDQGGEAELVTRVAEFAGVDISHFVRTSAEGITEMVGLVGGVPIVLTTEIDDPYAGNQVLFAGEQTLDGTKALELLRAMNISGGWESVAANRVAFTQALLARALVAEGLNLAAVISDASEYIDTDLSASDLMELTETFRPLDTATVYSCVVPGLSMTTSDDRAAFNPTTSEWKAMMERIMAGEDPSSAGQSEQDVDKSTTTVEVRNGTLTPGAAAQMASMLESDGFQIEEVGNTNDDTIYSETLVVYTDPAYAGAAKAVVRSIGGGRTVYGGDFYHSDANVIAIVGTDWTV